MQPGRLFTRTSPLSVGLPHVAVIGATLLLLCCGSRFAMAQASETGPPNIVILFADDLGYGDLGSYGHPLIRTPHLDGLAAEGVRLTSFYAGAPACTPSRAALLTGRYAPRTGAPGVFMPASTEGMAPSEVTIAEALKAEGYRTMAVGKWHLGHHDPAFLPTAQGFDDYVGLIYSNDMIPPWVQTDRPLRLYRGDKEEAGTVDQSRLTARYTDEAVRFIDEQGEAPFFLYLAYAMPHLPLAVAEAWRGRSRAGLYGDVIEAIDASVGQVLDALDRTGQRGNTIVVFTSDNGPWLHLPDRMLQQGNEPWHAGSPGLLRGSKQTTYEGGIRVPCIIHWPGRIDGGRTLMDMASVLDLFPTLVRAAGGAIPTDRPIDGTDLLPWLSGATERSPVETFYYVMNRRLEAVRQGPWKYRMARMTDTLGTLPADAVPPELYHLERDPSERYNVITDHPDVAERLRALMTCFAREIEAEVIGAMDAVACE